MNLSSIPRKSLASAAYDQLREAVRNGELQQGVVYSEGEVAERIGVSRTPVREALIELAREGLVTIRPQKGFEIRTLASSEQAEVTALRRAVEGLLVEQLAASASDSQVKALRALLRQQRACLSRPTDFILADEDFHISLAKMTGYERSESVLSGLRGSLYLIGNLEAIAREHGPSVVTEHEAIVDAIADHDPDAARRALDVHLLRAQALMLGSHAGPDE